MKEIPLTQGYAALVDDEDYVELSKYKWCLLRARHCLYAKRGVGSTKNHKTVLMHTQITEYEQLVFESEEESESEQTTQKRTTT